MRPCAFGALSSWVGSSALVILLVLFLGWLLHHVRRGQA
jgi:hypothetical protein